jgi:hypothetical protein
MSEIIIHASDLKCPCVSQVKIFSTHWPNGANLTLANIRRAAALKLDLYWFAQRFLTATARAAYQRALDPAWEAYERDMAPSTEAYVQAARTEPYGRDTATALAAMEQAHVTVLAAYQHAQAAALWEQIKRGGMKKHLRSLPCLSPPRR